MKNDSEGTVYENFPGAPKGGQPVVKSFGPTAESPSGYTDPTGLAGLGGPTTFGNNANTYANYSNFLVPADEGPRPVCPTSQFNYTYDNELAEDQRRGRAAVVRAGPRTRRRPTCSGSTTGSTTSSTTSASPSPPATSRPTAATRSSAWCTPVQRAVAPRPTRVGTTPTSCRCPTASRRGAGCSSGSRSTTRSRDRTRTATSTRRVIEHEYAHGLSTRYVAGGESLGSHQAGSMGEGWSDWYALNHLYRRACRARPSSAST